MTDKQERNLIRTQALVASLMTLCPSKLGKVSETEERGQWLLGYPKTHTTGLLRSGIRDNFDSLFVRQDAKLARSREMLQLSLLQSLIGSSVFLISLLTLEG
jgi:hypothetical protein